MSLHFFIFVAGYYMCEIYYNKHFFSRVHSDGYEFYKKLIDDESIKSRLVKGGKARLSNIIEHVIFILMTVFLLGELIIAYTFGLSIYSQIRALAATSYVSIICIGLYIESLSWHEFSTEFSSLSNVAETEEEKLLLINTLSTALVQYSSRRFMYLMSYIVLLAVDVITRFYIL